MQQFLVLVIVSWCCLYAVWALLPMGLKRSAAHRMCAWPLPGPLLRRLQRLAQKPGACACDGCDGPPRPAADAAERPIRIHRGLKR